MANDSGSSRDRAIRGRWPVLDILLGRKDPDGPRTDAEKDARRAEYEAFNRKLNEVRIGKYAYFQNYGYVANDNPTFCAVELKGHQLDLNSRRLVLEVIGDCSLEGKDVLDVSCGRGALAAVLKQSFRPLSYCGVDLSPEAVDFCRTRHDTDGYRFQEGDAEKLPCDDRSMDVVVNIEASHNYPNIDAFFGEVRRVLRPGGWFLYADFLTPAMFERNRRHLEASGFTTERDLDITSNVLLSSDQLGTMRLKTYEDPEVRAYMADFLAAPGSEMYRALKEGLLQYRLYQLRRTG